MPPTGAISRLTRSAGRLAEPLLDVLFPPRCVGCRQAAEHAGVELFCGDCVERLDAFDPPFCQGCGASVPAGPGPVATCGRCQPHRPRYDRAVALGPYAGLLRELLLRAKKPNGEIAAASLARLLVSERRELLQGLEADVVCPVPMHWRRRAVRLASSAHTMAEVVAEALGLPLARGLLVRRRATAPQYTLPPTARRENVRRAFRLGPGYQLQAAHVLLVDDILTTGATCSEASRTLKRAGASQVSVAVVARSFSDR